MKKDGIWIASIQMSNSICNFLLTIMLARVLSVEEFGSVAAILFAANALGVLSGSVAGQPILILGGKRKFEVNRLLHFGLLASAILASVILIIIEMEMLKYPHGEAYLFTASVLFRDVVRKYLTTLSEYIFLLVVDILYFSTLFLLLYLSEVTSSYLILNLYIISGFLTLLVFSLRPFFLRNERVRKDGRVLQVYLEFVRWNFPSGILVSISSFYAFALTVIVGGEFSAFLRAIQNVFGLSGAVTQMVDVLIMKRSGETRESFFMQDIRRIILYGVLLSGVFVICFSDYLFETLYGGLFLDVIYNRKGSVILCFVVASLTMLLSIEKSFSRSLLRTRDVFKSSLITAVFLVFVLCFVFYCKDETVGLVGWVGALVLGFAFIFRKNNRFSYD